MCDYFFLLSPLGIYLRVLEEFLSKSLNPPHPRPPPLQKSNGTLLRICFFLFKHNPLQLFLLHFDFVVVIFLVDIHSNSNSSLYLPSLLNTRHRGAQFQLQPHIFAQIQALTGKQSHRCVGVLVVIFLVRARGGGRAGGGFSPPTFLEILKSY